ncbi:MAG: DUF2891 domain-containing protein [Elusimicrobia bacterium]|nr:DUF2891 domain-containing protein [Elusimicrobiota bacterium]
MALLAWLSPAAASELSAGDASRFSKLALKCVRQEYPNKPDHVMADAADVRSPKAMHPAFYGCFDWHSCLHGHWLLARLLREFPGLPEAGEIRKALDENLTAKNVAGEIDYLGQKERKSFERTYGWAWLLKLQEELLASDDADARRWAKNLEPLAQALAARYEDFLPKQTYAIRTGVHPNTAFGIAFALDYARAAKNSKLEDLLVARAMDYYAADKDYPASWEPGGEDFFSPALMEADLMRRVLSPAEFSAWFHAFLPELPKSLSVPATVSDRSDPKLVHLDGLNLSRAWCLRGVSAALPAGDAVRKTLEEAADRHAADALANVASGHYEGEHWLASFAVYLLTAARYPRADADLAATDAQIAEARVEFAKRPADSADRKWVKMKLEHMLKTDVLLRRKFNLPFEKNYSRDETKYYMKRFDRQLQALDTADAADLKPLLKRYGWFKIGEWGNDADTAAWLVVQHSDEDVPFQKEVLGKLERLYHSGETDPANFALLWDRVAVHEERPQRFATQGGCAAPGRWEPDPFEDPPRIDERRKAVNLGPLKKYESENAKGCH